MTFIRTKKEKTKPVVNTSALPDIIFMLLFFFMVVTVLRQSQLMLKVVIPQASESTKIVHRSLVNHLHLGKPINNNMGTAPRVQLNDAFVPLSKVGSAVAIMTKNKPEPLQSLVITSMKIDEEVNMGIVNDVKRELRKAKQYKVQYAARKKIE